jgi:hypothetical protein
MDSNAGISHRYVGFVSLLCKGNFTVAAPRRVFHRIINQDQQQAIDRDGICAHPDGIFGSSQGKGESFVCCQDGSVLLRSAQVRI